MKRTMPVESVYEVNFLEFLSIVHKTQVICFFYSVAAELHSFVVFVILVHVCEHGIRANKKTLLRTQLKQKKRR